MKDFEKNEYMDEGIGELDEPKKKSRPQKNKYRGYGVILSFFFSVADGFVKALKKGFFGYLFADLYKNLNEKFKMGTLYNGAKKEKRRMKSQTKLAQLYEESLTNKIVSNLGKTLISTFVREWGVALFSFSFITVFVAMVKYYFIDVLVQESIIVGIILALLSIPLLVSKKRIGEQLLTGKFSGYIITQVLSLEESKLKGNTSHATGYYSLAFLFATIAGTLTYWISPLAIIEIVVLLIVFAVIMCFPELGIMSVLVIMPFTSYFSNPSIIIFVVLSFSLIGYISKLIRGKRVIRFELIDIFVAIFAILIVLGGIFTNGGAASARASGMYFAFLLAYFLIVNSYIRKTWIYRGIKTIVIITSIVALAGIFEEGVISTALVDMDMFSDIGARVGSFLGNPNMLGVYLVIVFPFVLGQMMCSQNAVGKIFYFICTAIMLACTVITWSRGAWLGLIVGVVIFFLTYNFRTIWLFIAGLLTSPLWYFVLPHSITNRFWSILTMTDSSSIYRINTWKGVCNAIFDNLLGGVGIGEAAFREVYANYVVPGTETVMHAHNLFLQITLELGIVGIVVFLIVALMFSQKCLVNLKARRKESKSRTMICAGLASVGGALVVGLTDHIWYNYRVFLLFWIVIALTVSLTKINEREQMKQSAYLTNSSREADLDIYY